MEKKEKIYELILGEDAEQDGVSKISFVEYPAIEENFMFFSKIEEFKFEKEGEKYMVTGPAMIPNKKIERLSADNKKYFVIFSEETIAKCMQMFFKRDQHKNSNVNHSNEIEGVTVVESWIIEDPENDKSNALGFKNLTKGTWMCSYKVENEELWSKIKAGEVQGFSIEGRFIEDLVKMSEIEEQKEEEDLYVKIIEVLNSDSELDKKYESIQEIVKKIE